MYVQDKRHKLSIPSRVNLRIYSAEVDQFLRTAAAQQTSIDKRTRTLPSFINETLDIVCSMDIDLSTSEPWSLLNELRALSEFTRELPFDMIKQIAKREHRQPKDQLVHWIKEKVKSAELSQDLH